MKLRRSTAALAAATALVLGGAPAASAEDAVPADENGLFGDGDPTHDGVYRQSLSLLALHAVGAEPNTAAVEWLTAQQCDDGSFTPYRADTGVPCEEVSDAEDEDGMGGPDTNATAMAVQALSALEGHEHAGPAAEAAAQWLVSVRNDDGAWPYTPGQDSDANSTGVVIGALAASGQDLTELTTDDGDTPYDGLAAFQLDCADAESPDEGLGGYAWQPDPDSGELFLNEPATMDGALAAQGSGMLVDPDQVEADSAPQPLGCGDAAGSDGPELSDEAAAEAAAGQLAALVELNDGHVTNSLAGGEPDFGLTAQAVVGLAAGGYGAALAAPLEWLQEEHSSWDDVETTPAALATLILAAHAGGADPADFGGSDLVGDLAALGQPTADGDSDATTESSEEPADEAAGDDDGSGNGVVLIIVVGLLAGIGGGILLSMRRQGGGSGSGPRA